MQYCGHIRRRDGLTGLWRGASPRLLNVVVQHFAEQKFNEVLVKNVDIGWLTNQ